LGTIGGGEGNRTLNTYATVAGGNSNTASGYRSMVGGGFLNTASDAYATVAGGEQNTASGLYGAIAGGVDNVASGYGSTVGGGENNEATGTDATIPGGSLGRATNTGAFVWSGDSSETTGSFGDYTFTVRAEGGVRFYTANGTGTGVGLASGSGTWTSLSDRRAKENFQPVDGGEVLAKLAAIPVMTWNYKTQDSSIRHIGPTAQDFKKAFGIGESDTGITTVDADGVALAAIQGLVAELKKRDETMAARDRTIEELKAKLQAVEERLDTLPPAP
jgi:hypothetical protein